MGSKNQNKKNVVAMVKPAVKTGYVVRTLNRNNSIFTGEPGDDYFTIERFCIERLFALDQKEREIDQQKKEMYQLRSENRLQKANEIERENELKKNQLMKAGFSENEAKAMLNAINKPVTVFKERNPVKVISSDNKIDDAKIYKSIITGSYENLNESEKSLASKISCIHRGFRGEGKGSLNCLSGMIDKSKDVIIAHALNNGQKNQVPLIKRYLKMKTA